MRLHVSISEKSTLQCVQIIIIIDTTHLQAEPSGAGGSCSPSGRAGGPAARVGQKKKNGLHTAFSTYPRFEYEIVHS